MRLTLLGLAALTAACASPVSTSTTLASADAATSLALGQQVTMTTSSRTGGEGQDALVLMQLRHADGRVMRFEEANHTPHDVMAQAAGGPLAQVMGLFGEEQPTLYSARADGGSGAPFFCGADGPVAIGLYSGADGGVQIVGLKQRFAFETMPDGSESALPYSPDQVCARLRLRRQ
jgi:hypothetical protein